MHPELLRISGGPTIYAYGVCLMLGFGLTTWWAIRRGRRVNVESAVILNIVLISVVFGVIGARLQFVLHYWERFADGPSPIKAALDVRQGGMEFLGGFICAALAITTYLLTTRCRSNDGKSRVRHPIRLYLDIGAPTVMLALAVTRLGCFLNGCCFGGLCAVPETGEARHPWVVQFPFGSVALVDQWERRQVTLPAELLSVSKNGFVSAPINRYTLAHAVPGRFSPALSAQLKMPSRKSPNRATSLSELNDLAANLLSRPVHPAQLYASINGFLLAALLACIHRVRRHHGVVFASMLMLYAPPRFLLERIRSDNPVDTMGMTISQFTSVLLCLVGLALLLLFRRRSMQLQALAIERPGRHTKRRPASARKR